MGTQVATRFALVFVVFLGFGCASTVSGAPASSVPADASITDAASDAAIRDAPPADRGDEDVVSDRPSADTVPLLNATLRVSIAAADVPRRIVKNARAFSMRAVFTSVNGLSNNIVDEFTVSGLGNVTGTLRRDDLRNVVLSCELRDGALSVGSVQVPTDRGRMTFTGLGFTVPAGISRGLDIFCQADSTIAQAYDEFSVGIASEADIVWHPSDPRLGRVTYLDDALRNQTGEGGAVPPVLIRVYPHGSMTIVPDSMRASTIVVPGDYWEVMARYRAAATLEDQSTDMIRIAAHGDSASFRRVAVAVEGRTLTSGILPAGRDQGVDLPLPTPLLVPADSSRVIEVWGELAPVVSYATTMAREGVARSGALISLGIASGNQEREWGSAHATSWNVRVIGGTSRAPIYVPYGDRLLGNQFMVRRSVPGIAPRPIATADLMPDVETEFYAWQMTSHPAGAVAWRKETFSVQVGRASGGELRLESFQLYRNGMLVPPADCHIVAAPTSLDLRGPLVRPSPDRFDVVVRFVRDEMVEGSGSIYSLRAIARNARRGDSVRIVPLRSPIAPSGEALVTGRIAPQDVIDLPGPHVNAAMAPGVVSIVSTAFLWSDLSDLPHGDMSFDWTNATYINDRTVLRVLIVP